MYSISKMTIDDYEKIKDRFDEFDDFWSPDNLESELKSEGKRYIKAQDEDEYIVGFAGIILSVDDAEITNIVTKKSERNKGIGSLLLEELIRITKEEGKDNISLEVNEENHDAIRLYEKYDFKLLGRRKKYYNNTHDALIMTKYF